MKNCNELTAKVVRVKNGRTFVAVSAPEKCEGCKACYIGRLDKSTVIPAKNEVGARLGDVVSIETFVSTNLATLTLILFPLAFFVAGVVLGATLLSSELLAGAIGIGAAAIAFAVALTFDRLVVRKKYAAKIISILSEPNDETVGNTEK